MFRELQRTAFLKMYLNNNNNNLAQLKGKKFDSTIHQLTTLLANFELNSQRES